MRLSIMLLPVVLSVSTVPSGHLGDEIQESP